MFVNFFPSHDFVFKKKKKKASKEEKDEKRHARKGMQGKGHENVNS